MLKNDTQTSMTAYISVCVACPFHSVQRFPIFFRGIRSFGTSGAQLRVFLGDSLTRLVHLRTVVQNRNFLFIISYKSYFLTDFEFCFSEILNIKSLRELSITIFNSINMYGNYYKQFL